MERKEFIKTSAFGLAALLAGIPAIAEAKGSSTGITTHTTSDGGKWTVEPLKITAVDQKIVDQYLTEDVRKWYFKESLKTVEQIESVGELDAVFAKGMYLQCAFNRNNPESFEKAMKKIFSDADKLTKLGYLGYGSISKCSIVELDHSNTDVCFIFPLSHSRIFDEPREKGIKYTEHLESLLKS